MADDQRRLINGNMPLCELLGIARDEMPWRTMDEFTPDRERQRLAQEWGAFLTAGALEGWYHANAASQEPMAVEFSATARVLPGRHLFIFIPVDEVFDAGAEAKEIEERGWKSMPPAQGGAPLTKREREVLMCVATGAQTNDAAEQLVVSSDTVKTHVANAMAKLGAHTRAHAIAIALTTGQISWTSADPAGGSPPSPG